MIFDIHTHVIPKVDDGASGIDESLKMLEQFSEQGVDKVIATPHFYVDKMSFEEYDALVRGQYRHMLAQAGERSLKVPETFLGCEVYYYKGMSQSEWLDRLTLGSSRYILIELPYEKIQRKVIDELTDIAINRNMIPVLAHVDRYLKFNSLQNILEVLSEGFFMAQLNADSFVSGFNKRKALELLESGMCQFIGSDAHNLTTRATHIRKALDYIEKKTSWKYINVLNVEAENLYNNLK